MTWLAIAALIVFALVPKAPGVFGYWHRWRGIRVERTLIIRCVCGFWSYDLMPGSIAERVAKVISEWVVR